MKLNLDFFINFQKYLIVVLPLALVTGPFIPDLIISLCAFLIVICLLIEKNFFFIKSKILTLFIIYCLYLISLSILKADNILLSLESSLFYFRFGLFVLSVFYILSKVTNFENSFLKYFFIIYSLVLLDSIIQFFFGINSIGLIIYIISRDMNLVHFYGFSYSGIYPSDRLSGLFGKELKLGSYISRLFPFFLIFLYKFYENKNNFQKLLLFILFSITFFVVFLSGERSAFFSMIIYFSIFTLIINFNYFFKLFSILLIVFSIGITSIVYKDTFNRMIMKTIDQIYTSTNEISLFSIQHEVVYTSAYRIFKDNIFFGIGPKMFREKCKEEKYQVLTDLDHSINGCQTHPHNTYMQLLSETGILGTMPVLLLFIYTFYFILIRSLLFKQINKSKISNIYIILLSSLFINLWPIIPTGNFFNNWLSIMYFFPIGFILYNKEKY